MKFVLTVKGFVTKLPTWFESWEEPNIILWNEFQMKGWNTKHLRSGGWYLDLLMTQVLEEEKELYEYCKHEEDNSTKGTPRRKVDVDVVEEI